MEDEQKPEVGKVSEWQDVVSQFQHISEVESFCENAFLNITSNPDKYMIIPLYLFSCRSFFRRFKGLCTEPEIKEFEILFDAGIKIGENLEKRIEQRKLFPMGPSITLNTKELKELENLLEYVCRMREEKGLGLRIHTKKRKRDRVKNAVQ